MKRTNLQVEMLPIEALTPYELNPRKNENAVEKVERSISEFGFNVPVLIDEEGVIVAGHTRYEAAKNLGMKEIPCIRLRDLDQDKIDQYRIIDNKTAELSSWDFDRLIQELDMITDVDMSIYEFNDSRGADEEVGVEGLKSNLYEGCEIELGDFDDEAFEYECPYCGFRWNE